MIVEEYAKKIKEWEKDFEKRRRNIIIKLLKEDKNIVEIIDYFNYDNMVEKELNYCPLYKNKEKCHDIEELNCFFCGCPFYQINECKINSKFSVLLKIDKDFFILDCSACVIPHLKTFVLHYGKKIIEKIKKDLKIKGDRNELEK